MLACKYFLFCCLFSHKQLPKIRGWCREIGDDGSFNCSTILLYMHEVWSSAEDYLSRQSLRYARNAFPKSNPPLLLPLQAKVKADSAVTSSFSTEPSHLEKISSLAEHGDLQVYIQETIPAVLSNPQSWQYAVSLIESARIRGKVVLQILWGSQSINSHQELLNKIHIKLRTHDYKLSEVAQTTIHIERVVFRYS